MSTAPQLDLHGPAGFLESVLTLPETTARGIAVIGHPHPLHGGSMQNKVVTTLERTFRELGHITLRFNFRGVGKSEGNYDHGQGEQDDMLAAIAALRQTAGAALPLCLSGFSFGSYIAAACANRAQATQLVSIAPPVQSWDFNALPAPSMPWLIVQGEQDEIVDAHAVFAFAASRTPPARLIRMQATHFFHGVLTNMRQLLQDALA
jgi:uncharacterized protein